MFSGIFSLQDVDVKRQGAVTAYAFIQFTDITSVVKALKDLDGTTWGSTKLKVNTSKRDLRAAFLK